MSDTDKKYRDAIMALLDMAASNFPANSDIEISTKGGANHGRIVVPVYALRRIIKADSNG